jgi:hypothetical protein
VTKPLTRFQLSLILAVIFIRIFAVNYKKICMFALLLQSTVLFAHDPSCCDHTHRWWWNLGVGAGHASTQFNDFSGVAAQLSFNGMISDTLFVTLEWTSVSKDNDYHNDESAREVGLLLGYKSKRPNWYWSAAAGLGAAKSEQEYISRGNYFTYTGTQEQTTLSVPVEAQLFYTPFKHFGIGIVGHASVSKNPFATAMLAIQFA